jgi:glycosyltransferase involved in cell wall biosynthesis
MRIGLLAPPVEPVPPPTYGGTERVVASLADALVDRGHDVALFASGESRTRARLVPTVERAIWHDDRYVDPMPLWTLAVSRGYAHASELDVMHNHCDHFAYPIARLSPVPTVTTLHGRLDLPELRDLYREFREQPLVSVSVAQRAPLPDAHWVANIPHGYAEDLYRPSYEPGRYLAFCGRFSRDKGVTTAIDAAVRSGVPLKIAARQPRADRVEHDLQDEFRYWEDVVLPRIRREPLVEYVGELDEAGKQELYAGALALLFPIDWPEPFGLVMIEALACGTPVIARPRGSVPEVIRDGVTGFHCETVPDFVRAIGHVGLIDRAACRRDFEERFTAGAMAARYERVYREVIEATSRSTLVVAPAGRIPPADVEDGEPAPAR